MEQNKFIKDYISLNRNNLPKDSNLLKKLEDKFALVNEQQQNKVYDVKMKNPKVAFLLSIFNLDRFYNGQPILGILKIITFGGLGIWTVIDLFLSTKKTREDNLQRLLNMPIDTSSSFSEQSFVGRMGSEIGQHIQDTLTDAVKEKAGKFIKEKASSYLNRDSSESQDVNMVGNNSEYPLEGDENEFDEDGYEEDSEEDSYDDDDEE